MPPVSEQRVREIIREELGNFLLTDKYVFEKLIQFADGRNVQLGKTTGTKFGTATNQKLAFYNTTPVDQPATVSDPSGGGTVDTEARTAIDALIDRLQELGLIS